MTRKQLIDKTQTFISQCEMSSDEEVNRETALFLAQNPINLIKPAPDISDFTLLKGHLCFLIAEEFAETILREAYITAGVEAAKKILSEPNRFDAAEQEHRNQHRDYLALVAKGIVLYDFRCHAQSILVKNLFQSDDIEVSEQLARLTICEESLARLCHNFPVQGGLIAAFIYISTGVGLKSKFEYSLSLGNTMANLTRDNLVASFPTLLDFNQQRHRQTKRLHQQAVLTCHEKAATHFSNINLETDGVLLKESLAEIDRYAKMYSDERSPEQVEIFSDIEKFVTYLEQGIGILSASIETSPSEPVTTPIPSC